MIYLAFCDILFYILQKGDEISVKESGEMYLESVYILCKSKSRVRSIDIAEHMNYSKPSVCRAVGLLKGDGYINVDKDGYITLTPLGEKRAKKIYERHTILSEVLISLGVDEKTAVQDACRMEHVISEKTFSAIKKHRAQYKK